MAPRLYSGGIAVRCLKLTTKGQAPYWLGFSLSMPKPKLLRSPFTSPTTGTRLCRSASARLNTGSLAVQCLRPPCCQHCR